MLYASYETVHTVSTFMLHLLRNVRVCVERKRCGVVPEVFLNGLDVVTRAKGCDRVAVA